MTIDEYKQLLAKRLNPQRYKHSLCVADEALRLAEKYGGDKDKCYLAGLLHDITKNAPKDEHLQLFRDFGIILSSVEANAQKLWHAMSGSLYVRHKLGINDDEIITAIRYHTTARAGMTLTDKILYLADFTSADRDYDDVDVMRRLVDISMDEALKYALSYSIVDLVNKGKPIHPDTLEAYNEICL
ncbi:MAG: bis(5'-nucleosyl)-tetraphosphatase (symmetrical) YqeK [Clostridia bacterium]|nr:bis(5'-nucleosyl)-tetraphosphatase (symmetrical) YqeK [Clostridia bacterium]